MGFWGAVGNIAGTVAKSLVEEYNDLNEDFKHEQHRLSGASDEELKKKARSGSSTAQKLAAKKLLQNRGVIPSSNSTSSTPKKKLKSKVSPSYRKGNSAKVKTTIVLSAPGQEEEKAGRPAAGQTGKTLQMAIEEMHSNDPESFPSNNLDDYSIVNAVEDVHYKAKTGRTEGTDSKILEQENLDRINSILQDSKNVVALGEKAQLAVKNSSFSGNTFEAEHPSMQALNKKYKSNGSTPSERHKDRVNQWTRDIEK